MKVEKAISILALVSVIGIPALAATIVGQVTIFTITCGLNTNISSINFGNLFAGQNSSVQVVNVFVGGNFSNASTFIRGTNWTSIVSSFPVQQTLWINVTERPLTEFNQLIRTIFGPTGFDLGFKLMAPLGQLPTNYTQNITLTVEC